MRDHLRLETQSVNKNRRPTILVFSPSTSGGLAEYIYCQSKALEKAGNKVICLVAPSFLAGRPTGFEKIICLSDPPAASGSRLIKRFKMARRIIANQLVLAWQIWKRRPDLVLLDSYVEYFAPLWVWPHWVLARFYSVRYAANLHDPVRNFVVGPAWWHKLSVRLAYLPLDFVLVHDKLPEPSPVPSCVRVAQVPHGIFEIRGSPANRDSMRREWGVQDGQKVFLAFGFVRDGKNLDLAVRSLAQVPEAVLVMAGSVASAKDKPFAFYRKLASEIGVAERCHFYEGFVSDDDLGKYFMGTDFVLLTYASSFHSQSGVLNIAARARKPVLASASPSPLIESVRKFQLGVIVEPDSLAAVGTGMQRLLAAPPSPRWDDYEATASWTANAQGVLEAAGLQAKAESGK
jgi:glycosyltransferase involved in cell wall biosynthesis